MKLTEPIPAARLTHWRNRLFLVALVLGAVAFALDKFGLSAAHSFTVAALILGGTGYFIWNYLLPDARRDDWAMAANANAKEGQPMRRVGTRPWAYWALGIALVGVALIFLVAAL